jgi:eukaryotic-like serine/threonine-protein kinase
VKGEQVTAAERRVLANRYELSQPLGVGGMSEVFEAHDTTLGRRVAVKLLRSDLAHDPNFHERFRREAMAAASLNHPNIVSVYDAGEDTIGGEGDARSYIVMEYVDGITLRQLINSGRKLLPERAFEITLGVLNALDYSHRSGVVHRDIKPANVMLTRSSDVRVMDFGIARVLADLAKTVTQGTKVMGTAQYISPEQARGELADARSDLYSAGCLLYELLTGRPPFTGETPVSIAYQHVSAPLVPASELDATLPAGTDELLAKALAKNPDERYQSADAFAKDVQAVLAGAPLAAAATQMIPTLEHTSALPILDGNATDAIRSAAAAANEVDAQARRRKQIIGWTSFGAGLIAVVAVIALLASFVLNANKAQSSRVNVPMLVGLTVTEAKAKLVNVGLKLGNQETRRSKDYPRDTVIEQSYPQDTSIASGTTVDVVVSSGSGAITVPSLTNYVSIDDARAALERIGLALGAVTYQDNSTPTGTVLSQNPVAGQDVDSSTAVDIVVSNGKVLIPDVLNKTESVARALLSNAGFQVIVEYQTLIAGSAGVVVSQTPDSTMTGTVGSIVNIVVSRASTSPTDSATPTGSSTPTP